MVSATRAFAINPCPAQKQFETYARHREEMSRSAAKGSRDPGPGDPWDPSVTEDGPALPLPSGTRVRIFWIIVFALFLLLALAACAALVLAGLGAWLYAHAG